MQNQEYQFDDIVADIYKEKDMSRNPIFDMMFVMQNNNTSGTTQEANGFELEYFGKNPIKSQFDLSLVAVDDKKNINYVVKYNVNLFKKSTMDAFGKEYLHLLEIITENTETSLDEIQNSFDNFRKKVNKLKREEIKIKNIQSLKKDSL